MCSLISNGILFRDILCVFSYDLCLEVLRDLYNSKTSLIRTPARPDKMSSWEAGFRFKGVIYIGKGRIGTKGHVRLRGDSTVKKESGSEGFHYIFKVILLKHNILLLLLSNHPTQQDWTDYKMFKGTTVLIISYFKNKQKNYKEKSWMKTVWWKPCIIDVRIVNTNSMFTSKYTTNLVYLIKTGISYIQKYTPYCQKFPHWHKCFFLQIIFEK